MSRAVQDVLDDIPSAEAAALMPQMALGPVVHQEYGLPGTVTVAGMTFDCVVPTTWLCPQPEVVFVPNTAPAIGCLFSQLDEVRQQHGPGHIAAPSLACQLEAVASRYRPRKRHGQRPRRKFHAKPARHD